MTNHYSHFVILISLFVFGQTKNCSHESGLSLVNCEGLRLLKKLDLIDQKPTINLLPGVNLVGQNISARSFEQPIWSEDPLKKSTQISEQILKSTIRFFAGKTLKVQLPDSNNLGRALEEGRAKVKKMMNPYMMGLGSTIFSMVPVILGSLGLLASKALVVAKVALVMSVIVFFSYFSGQRGSWNIIPSYYPSTNFLGTSYGVPSPSYGIPSSGGYPNSIGNSFGTNNLGGWSGSLKRSLETSGQPEHSTESQDLAYSAYN